MQNFQQNNFMLEEKIAFYNYVLFNIICFQ
jgi:hypothetical protein